MSNQDSFIDEVTEEVRRDRLYAIFRKYGWIAILAVLVLVGGAAWNEWRKSTARAEAQAAGDALIAALDVASAEERAAALAALETPEEPGRRAIALLMQAGAEAEAGNTAAARDTFDRVAGDAALPARIRDIATLKAVILSAGETAPEDRISRLSAIAVPGSPYRLLALEQIALAEIESGETEKAIETLERIAVDADITQDLRRRVSQLIVALGGELAAT
ncbi:MAG: tetratricopeptide repeat protein [Silicimonas sp.]